MSDSATLLARAFIAASYSPDVPMTQRPRLDACAPVLERVAKRIARNTLRSEHLTTDNLGVRVRGLDERIVGTLWSYVGGPKWMSSFFCASDDPQVALDSLAQWAFDKAPPFRLQLLDADVPLLGSGVFGIGPSRAPPTPCCDCLATAQRHGYVVSIVETCQFQGRDPETFLTEVLSAP